MSPEMFATLSPTVHVVLREETERNEFATLLRAAGLTVSMCVSAVDFIHSWRRDGQGCLVLDMRVDDADGRFVQENLLSAGLELPIILIAGQAGVTSAVRRLKALAVDFLVTPVDLAALVESVVIAVKEDAARCQRDERVHHLRARYETLTRRERQVLSLVCDGLMNKQVAALLNLSVITIKIHRSSVMRKLCCRRLVELVRAVDALGITTSVQSTSHSTIGSTAVFA